MSTAGFVLVGGKSSRMGQSKALLPWGSGVLAQEIAMRVAAVAGTATLIGDPHIYGSLGFTCLPDLRPGYGPLSGLEALLTARFAERNLVLACDILDASEQHLEALLAMEADCVITEDQAGHKHPLCGVYSTACLDNVSRALDEKRLKLLDLTRELGAVTVRYFGTLLNINSPEDFASALGRVPTLH